MFAIDVMLDAGPMPMCACMLLLLLLPVWMLGRDWGELPGPPPPPPPPPPPAPRWCSPYDDGWPWPCPLWAVGVFMGMGRGRGRVCKDDTGGRWTPASDWGERLNGEYAVVLAPLLAPDAVATEDPPPPPPAVPVE